LTQKKVNEQKLLVKLVLIGQKIVNIQIRNFGCWIWGARYESLATC